MTEEVDRRHGVNGNSSSKGVNDDPPVHSSATATSGGRLKFFKDGKFILELVRGSAREGERAGWVSVPRKTFWPPAAAPPTPPTPPHAAPPCASLSDDNSSLHSSPCTSHRDHCWKQPTPRRHLSKELAMYYCRPATLLTAHIHAASRRKRRRPFDTAHHAPARHQPPNGLCDKRRNGDIAAAEDVVDAPTEAKTKMDDDRWTDFDREKYYHMKLKKPYQYHKLRVYKKTRPAIRRKELTRTIDRLREKVASLPVLVNAKLASCRQEHMMVSPRKRILREMERVSLEDQGTKRRAKTVPALSTASYPPSPGPSHAGAQPARAHNGTVGAAPRKDAPVSKNVSSYSIHSLLSMPDESPARSPHPPCVRSPDLSPSPDGYRYRYSALTLGSPGRGPARDSPTPPQPAPPPPPGRYAPPTPPYGPGAAGGRSRVGGAGVPRARRVGGRALPAGLPVRAARVPRAGARAAVAALRAARPVGAAGAPAAHRPHTQGRTHFRFAPEPVEALSRRGARGATARTRRALASYLYKANQRLLD
ncbi:unnamed protein product, partial [Brenthis ino]